MHIYIDVHAHTDTIHAQETVMYAGINAYMYPHTLSCGRLFLQSVSNVSCSLLNISPYPGDVGFLLVSGLYLLSYTDGSGGPIT